MDTIVLRRKVEIDNTTPLIIIDYLCWITGIDDELNKEEKIKQLSSDSIYKRIPNKGTEWTEKDWRYIARFVNPNVTWKSKNLYKAFISILRNEKYRSYGERNNYTPEIGDIIDAYNACCELGIILREDISYNEMTSILMVSQMNNSYISLLNTNIPKYKLVEAYIQNDLSTIVHSEQPNEEAVISIPPKTETDAFYSALKNKCDLSLAECKLVEYYRTTEHYVCDTLQNISNINPYRLKIGHYFNPRIPISYYDEQQINEMAMLEGITGTIYEKYQGLLELAYLNNFHHLIHPEVQQTESLYMKESFDQIDKLLIVSYGVLSFSSEDYKKNQMSAYTIPELTHMFQSNKNFINDFTKERFPNHAINKLERICRGLVHNNKVSSDVKRKCNELIQAIEINREIERNDCEDVKRWVEEVKNKSNVQNVVICLQVLMKAGLYMRKWDGSNNLPLREVSSEPLSIEEEDRVYSEISKFEKVDTELENIISKLPLIKHEYGGFQVITDKFEGLSIGERINIVKKGNTINEMSSCIKCSSNLIITSSYYYLLMLGEPIKVFNIKDLRYVSE